MGTLSRFDRLFNSHRGRALQENLTAYVFLAPALLLLFVFGIFPVGFAFFVSLHRWRRFPGNFLGLNNYVQALDNLAYVLFFWLSVGALVYALMMLRRMWKANDQRLRAFSALIPGAITGAAVLLLINWITILLPIILNIPQQLRGQERTQGLFVSTFFSSFQTPEAVAAGNPFLLAGIAAIVVSIVWLRFVRSEQRGTYWIWGTVGVLAAAIGVLLMQATVGAIQIASEAAQSGGDALPIWSQIIFISAGVALIIAAYVIWQRALKQDGDRRFVVTALAAVLLVIGGYALAVELPRALANADPEVLRGFNITVMFAIGTVPFQLAIGLGLAYLLFQNIRGKAFFRIVYFLPYIMPFVATSIVFNLIFSFRPASLANHALQFFGVPVQKWITEPTGVFQLIFGPQTPSVLVGPSLALIVIMLYTTWTYIGYDAVIFLAGLGNIPGELYEAARIDGATDWSIFRYLTLPLLSPTTFFLSLIAIIGTFQAFTQIWIMRTPASQSSVDTLGVYIFRTVQNTDPNLGYGSAVAFVLFAVILLLTVFQNRIAGSKV
ncbi:MAG: sugar ABC transporter permease, partial [Chloroflexota bacterium]